MMLKTGVVTLTIGLTGITSCGNDAYVIVSQELPSLEECLKEAEHMRNTYDSVRWTNCEETHWEVN